MNTLTNPIPRSFHLVRGLRLVARLLVLAWAGFWTWFALSVAFSEGPPSWPYAGGIVGVLAVVVVVSWLNSRAAAIALALAAVGAAIIFPGYWARLLLAAPALVLAILFFTTRRMEHGRR